MSFSNQKKPLRPWKVYYPARLPILCQVLPSLRSSSFDFLEYQSPSRTPTPTRSTHSPPTFLISCANLDHNHSHNSSLNLNSNSLPPITIQQLSPVNTIPPLPLTSLLELLEWLVNNRDSLSVSVRVSCILDKEVLDRCNKLAQRCKGLTIDRFWGVDQLGENPTVLVLPYEMISPLRKYYRVMVMKQPETLETDLLKTILNDNPTPTPIPSPPRLPTPPSSTSLHPSNPHPPLPHAIHTVFDLDPYSCLKLEAYCRSHSIKFLRIQGQLELTAPALQNTGAIIMVSKEAFDKVRRLQQEVPLVMVCDDLHNLSQEEVSFAKEFKERMLVMLGSKDTLISYLEENRQVHRAHQDEALHEAFPESKAIKPNQTDKTVDQTQVVNSELSKRYPAGYEVPKKIDLSSISKSLLDMDITSPVVISNNSLGLIAEEDATAPLSPFLSNPVLPYVEPAQVINQSYGYGLARYLKQSNKPLKPTTPKQKPTTPKPTLTHQNPYQLPQAPTQKQRKSFLQAMFERQLVYILVDQRYSTLIQKIQGIKSFNPRLRVEGYTVLSLQGQIEELRVDSICVVVALDRDVLTRVTGAWVFGIYCGKEGGGEGDMSMIMQVQNVKGLMEMLTSIPRFFRHRPQEDIKNYKLIHLYFEDRLPQKYKIKILELAEQEKRKIVPHQLGNHYEILCSAEKLPNEMFVCIVDSAPIYERIQSRKMPNVKVCVHSLHKAEMEELFKQLNALSKSTNPVPLSSDFQRRLINAQFKKYIASDSSGISQSSSSGKFFSSLSQNSLIQNLSNLNPSSSSPQPLLARLSSLSQNGLLTIITPTQNEQLRQMLRGLPGLNVIDYTTLHSLQGALENRPVESKRLVVCNEAAARYVVELRRMYRNTEYVVIAGGGGRNTVEEAITIQSNLRLAVLLCARVELNETIRVKSKHQQLPSHFTLLLPSQFNQPKWRQHFPHLIPYTSPNNLQQKLTSKLPLSGLSLVITKDTQISKVQNSLTTLSNIRFLRIITNSFNQFSTLTESQKVLAEVGTQQQAMQCAVKLVVYGRVLGLVEEQGRSVDLRRKRAVFKSGGSSSSRSSGSLLARSRSERFHV